VLASRQVVIATGGVGGLFLHTTNPAASWGSGIVLAARAGAVIADPEFVQFHPTALDVNAAPMPLISEAVRGEGARLIDETGRHFLQATAVSELSPRDMVARAIWRHLETGHHVFLNVCPVARFAQRFPSIHALCLAAGIDPATQPIPVRPAAHYHMGGIAVDAEGRSTVPGLWACGEAACTGLHGANRLASNSLLEAGVAAQRVAASVVACVGADSPPLPSSPEAVLPAHPNADPIRPILSSAAGLLREQHRLEHAINRLASYIALDGAAADPAVAGLLIAVGALQRRESRGAHYRLDHPHHGTAPPVHTRLTLDDCLKGFA
jgi:L-aspartate oxidase